MPRPRGRHSSFASAATIELFNSTELRFGDILLFGKANKTVDHRPFKRLPALSYAILLCAFSLLSPARASAQSKSPDTEFTQIPFDRWVAEGPREQIPWKVIVKPPALSVYQRLLACVEVRIDGKEVIPRQGKGQLVTLIQMSDSSGRTYREHGDYNFEKVDPEIRKSNLIFSFDVLVVPGEYGIALVLYDSATQERSVTLRTLHVDAFRNDPLVGSWRDFPPVEILPQEDTPDAWYRPTLAGRFYLPLKTRSRVRIEVLANLASGRRRSSEGTLGYILPLIKLFSQVEVTNGSLDVAAIDIDRRRVSFEQPGGRDLDWPRLKAALRESNPDVIDVASLAGRKQNASFFATEMVRRISGHGDSGGSPAGGDPRVFIVLSSGVRFDDGTKVHPIQLDGPCNCRVFYLRFVPAHNSRIVGFQVPPPTPSARRMPNPPDRMTPYDSLPDILKPLHPRVFTVQSPEVVRRALARMLSEISQM